MARKSLEVKVSSDLASFNSVAKRFPDIRQHFFRSILKFGRLTLKGMVSGVGAPVHLTAIPTDKAGKHTIKTRVNRKKTGGSITSYPLNLFENGRTLRSGRVEPGKYIITKKLKSQMDSRMQSVADRAVRTIIQKEFDTI